MPNRHRPYDDDEGLPPSQRDVTTTLDQLSRITTAAASDGARQAVELMLEKVVRKEEAQDIADAAATKAADAAVSEMMYRIFGLKPGDRDGELKLREDFTAMRSSLELRRAITKHGILAVIGVLSIGIVTAIGIGLKGILQTKGMP